MSPLVEFLLFETIINSDTALTLAELNSGQCFHNAQAMQTVNLATHHCHFRVSTLSNTDEYLFRNYVSGLYSIDSPISPNGMTTLMACAYLGSKAQVKWLSMNGANGYKKVVLTNLR